MHQLNHQNIDSRINDFLARKTAPKNLSQLIADRLIADQHIAKSRSVAGYELLPMRRRLSASH